MKLFPVLLAFVGFGLCSCERHEWHTDGDKDPIPEPKSDDTVNLFRHHGTGHDEEHGDKKDGDHAEHNEEKEAATPAEPAE